MDALAKAALFLSGVGWHLFYAETASLFWLKLGYSSTSSRILAVSGGLVCSILLCIIGFSLKIFRSHKVHEYLANHPWVMKLPYPGIAILGLFSPVGGVVIGILIARNADLPKVRAALLVLTINLIKLCGWGKIMTILFVRHTSSLL